MSFWSDASPVVKGVIVVGAVGLFYLGIAKVAGFAPFTKAAGGEVSQTRGVTGAGVK